MGAVVVALDVAGDSLSGVVQCLVFVQPDLPFFEFPEPALDERLRFGVAVAAAAVADPELAEFRAEAAGGGGRAVVGAEDERGVFAYTSIGCDRSIKLAFSTRVRARVLYAS